MNIICVYSVEQPYSVNKPMKTAEEIPFGIASILTSLEHAGHTMELLVFSSQSPIREMLQTAIKNFKPDLLCLTAVSTQYPLISRVAKIARALSPSLYIVMGGHHASLQPEQSIVNPDLNAICLGEGDFVVVELARQLSAVGQPYGIPGLWIKRGESGQEIERNLPGRFNVNIDELPFINRAYWSRWIQNEHEMPSVLVGRGCPYRCTYCSNHAMQKLAKGKYVRFRSVDNVIAEIDAIVTGFPQVLDLYLEVETIGVYPDYCIELGEKLIAYNARRKIPLRFGANLAPSKRLLSRTEVIDQILSLFHQAGIVFLNIGLESGSERLRKEVLRRPEYTNEVLIDFSQHARKHHIDINLFILFGLPGETPKDYLETIRVARSCRPHHVHLSIFFPYPGTDLYDLAVSQGLIDSNCFGVGGAERLRPVLKSTTFPRYRVALEYVLFPLRCFWGVWPYSKIVYAVVRNAMNMNPRLFSVVRKLVFDNRITGGLLACLKSRPMVKRD